jgi:hypothetical protein
MAAMRADFPRGFKLAMEDHLLALRTLVPEVVRRLLAPEQGADARADEFGEPVHCGAIRRCR